MPKHIRLLIVLTLVLGIGGLAVAFYRAREPRYQGRTLTAWIEEGNAAYGRFVAASITNHSDLKSDPDYSAARHAIKHMGPDAIPFLLKWLQAKDSPIKKKLTDWLDDHPIFRAKIQRTEDLHFKALAGFCLLGREAKPVWPALVQLTYDPDWKCRSCACDCLIASQADKDTLLPVLLRLIHAPEQRVRTLASIDFQQQYPQDAEAVRLLNPFVPFATEPMIRAGSIKFSGYSVRQVLDIYSQLSDTPLDVNPDVKNLLVRISFENKSDLGRSAVLKLLREAIRAQTGIVIVHTDDGKALVILVRPLQATVAGSR